MNKKALSVISLCLLVWVIAPTVAEEQRDLLEGITGTIPSESEWGLLPRFKVNPDTGYGTGLKLKGQNIFGTPLMIDIANIYTTNEYQIYEFLLGAPRIMAKEDSWLYLMLYGEYDLIPDYRFFGIGNNTENEMDDPDDEEVGDESSFEFEMALARIVLGYHPGMNLYIALEGFYKEVWLDSGDNDDLPNGMIKYALLPGTKGGKTSGMGIALIYSTRNDQWRATEGQRIELKFEDVGSHFGADYDFSRFVLDYRKFIHLFGKYNVLALHARIDALEGVDSEIPWWELASIGGRDSIRGLWEARFRGKSSVLGNAEFRYHIMDLKSTKYKFIDFIIDGNLFLDVGQVFLNEKVINDGLALDYHSGYGFGFRFTTPPNLMGRMDIGFSTEQQWAFYFNFGTVF